MVSKFKENANFSQVYEHVVVALMYDVFNWKKIVMIFSERW